MKIFAFVLMLMFSCFNSENSASEREIVSTKIPSTKKILIVYLSRTNNTKAVAEMIHEKVGGDIKAIEPKVPYSKDYKTNVEEVSYQNENGILPELKTAIDISQYDTIFMGFPTWGMQLPPPIKTFLNNNDWSGKTIIPFNTNAGYGLGSSKSQIESYCSKGKISEIFSVKGGHEREGILYVMKGEKRVKVQSEVQKWFQKIGF